MWDNSHAVFAPSRASRIIFMSDTPILIAPFFTLFPWQSIKILVHSWIKRDQLDVTYFFISLFTAQHVLDVNTSILRSLKLIWRVISWVVLFWYDVCWCYVVVWLGWCGIRMPHIVPEQYNPWNNSTNKSQAPEDGWINIRNMLSIK